MKNLIAKLKKIGAVLLVMIIALIVYINIPKHLKDDDSFSSELRHIDSYDITVETEIRNAGKIKKKKLKTEDAQTYYGVSDATLYYSEKFSGIKSIYSEEIEAGSNIYVKLDSFEIKEGNMRFFVLFDGEIVDERVIISELKPSPNRNAEYFCLNVAKAGKLEYVIAGESANFTFVVPTDWKYDISHLLVG